MSQRLSSDVHPPGTLQSKNGAFGTQPASSSPAGCEKLFGNKEGSASPLPP